MERVYAEEKKQTAEIMTHRQKEAKDINSTLNVMKVLRRRAQKVGRCEVRKSTKMR